MVVGIVTVDSCSLHLHEAGRCFYVNSNNNNDVINLCSTHSSLTVRGSHFDPKVTSTA